MKREGWQGALDGCHNLRLEIQVKVEVEVELEIRDVKAGQLDARRSISKVSVRKLHVAQNRARGKVDRAA